MVSDAMYRRMCMSGWQEQLYQMQLSRRRADAEWKRDRDRLHEIVVGRYPQYVDRVPKGPLTRLSARGFIKITEEFFPTLGVSRYRIDFVTWLPKEEINLTPTKPRALTL